MKLGIIGTGMMGCSIGLRARRNGVVVYGYDVDTAVGERARVCGAINELVSRSDIYTRCDVVIIATHLDGTLAELARLQLKPQESTRLIIDISSTKKDVCEMATGLKNFIGTHPMAGNELVGPEGANADLFEGRTWSYVPNSDENLNEHVRSFISDFGATPLAITAPEHDQIVALTSHMPQLFATLFAQRLNRQHSHQNAIALCGPTARELLRLKNSRFAMWGPILDANRESVERVLREFAEDLLCTADALRDRNETFLAAAFARAQITSL